MTNKEWRRSRDPVAMIRGIKDIAGNRKSLLYMVAGCRMLGDLVYDESSKEALHIVERYADGLATREEFDHAESIAECPTFGYDFQPQVWRNWHPDGSIPSSVKRLVEMGVVTEQSLEDDELDVDPELARSVKAAVELAYFACRDFPLQDVHGSISFYLPRVPWPGDWLLRCVFGKPFLPAVTIDPVLADAQRGRPGPIDV